MAKHSKRYRESAKKVDRDRRVTLAEAIDAALSFGRCKFDETVEVAVRLGVDPRQADQNVRGTVALPNGTGKELRVLVFAKGDKAREAEEAGADFVGGEDLVKRIQEESWLDFEKVVATPDMMSQVGRIGKILGPRGLMPNPKVGTVTTDVGRTVREIKAGKIEFRVDKSGIVHAPIGKMSFGADKLRENAAAVFAAILRAKPAAAKGNYLRSVALTTTMGPGIRIDPADARGVSP